MTREMTTFDDFVLRAATNYLQSVVFVDDRIYEPTGLQAGDGLPPDLGVGLTSQFVREAVEREVDAAMTSSAPLPAHVTQNIEHPLESSRASEYHPRELMESFAASGIVCALYEPPRGFTTDRASSLFRICERADVVIVDWDLYGDDGSGASRLLSELIQASNDGTPHHVRLCVVYTSHPSLKHVLDSVIANLKGAGRPSSAQGERLQVAFGATRISILGKPSRPRRVEEEQQFEVQERNLAGRIIEEFASFHRGLMPAFALHGVASIRRATKRLLDKFESGLDGAFLLHRSLVSSTGDAIDELPELLSDEIRAVLEDTRVPRDGIEAVVRSVASAVPIDGRGAAWKTSKGVDADAVRDVRRLLGGDAFAADETSLSKEMKSLKKEDKYMHGALQDIVAMLNHGGTSWVGRLAELYSTRTQYATDHRPLEFGTVVRYFSPSTNSHIYSVCLMPTCDSRRLAGTVTFPFWRLHSVEKPSSGAKRYGIVVTESDGTSLPLAAGGKIRDRLWLRSFVVEETRGIVTATSRDGKFVFTQFDDIQPCLEWISQLKPLHAQRIAAFLGTEVSRVGLVESEWLRLLCER